MTDPKKQQKEFLEQQKKILYEISGMEPSEDVPSEGEFPTIFPQMTRKRINKVYLDGTVTRRQFGYSSKDEFTFMESAFLKIYLRVSTLDTGGFNTPVLFLGDSALQAHEWINRGDVVRIIGRLHRRAYQAGGQWKSIIEIIAEKWITLEERVRKSRIKNSPEELKKMEIEELD